jgi:hypothetical protein
VVIDEHRFYATNDFFYPKGLKRFFEMYTRQPWGHVVFYDGEKMRKVAQDITYPNGIGVSGENLYVVSSTNRQLRIYEIKDNNNLKLSDVVDVGILGDNLHINGNDIFITGIQNGLKFKKAFENLDYISPSIVVKVSRNQNRDVFYGKKYNVETIFAHDKVASIATTFVHYKNVGYITGLLTNGIYVCPNILKLTQ